MKPGISYGTHLYSPASPEDLRGIGPSVQSFLSKFGSPDSREVAAYTAQLSAGLGAGVIRGILGRCGQDGPVDSFCFMEPNVFGVLEESPVYAEHPDDYLCCIDAFMHFHRVPEHAPVRMDIERETAELIRHGMVARGFAEYRRSNMGLSPLRKAGSIASAPGDLRPVRFVPTIAGSILAIQREAYQDQPDAAVFPELFMSPADPSRSNLGFGWSDVDADLSPCLADRDGLAGYCLVRSGPDSALVLDLAVRPSRARRGVGRFLLEDAICRCAGAGLREIELSVTIGGVAHRLYRNLGFRDAAGFSFFRIG